MSSEPEYTAPPAGRYEIDPEASTVAFATRHMFGTLPVHGTFTIDTGTVQVADPITDSSVRVQIPTASFDTGTHERDKVVRSRKYLDVDRHPTMVFESERLEGERLHGTLSAHGVTKPVTLALEPGEVGDDRFTARASIRIDRTDFGVTAGRGLTGRYLDVTIEVSCVRH